MTTQPPVAKLGISSQGRAEKCGVCQGLTTWSIILRVGAAVPYDRSIPLCLAHLNEDCARACLPPDLAAP